MFKHKPGAPPETQEQKGKKLELLNEYLSDQFLERLSGLLMKHFTEKEQSLKLLLQKYTDQQLAERDAIKGNFAIDYEKLNEIKDQLGEDKYNDALKKMRLAEENMLRTAELKINKAHKDEEGALRKELEKKHAAEQLKFRQNLIAQ